MAIAMARQGGIGVLHRNLSIDDQAYQVDLVKRTQTGIISNPVTIGPDATLEQLDQLAGEYRISGFPVVDTDNRLIGIITNRDLRFTPVAEWATTKVDEVMTPMPLITGAGRDLAARTPRVLLRKHKRERLPLVDDEGRLAGLITVKDFVKSEQFPDATKDAARPAPRRRRDRLLRRRLAARDHPDRRRRRRPRRRHRARPRPDAARHGPPAQDRPGHPARPGHRRQRRHPRGRPGVRRRRRGRGQGRGRPGLDLYDAGGHRRRRTADHGRLRGRAGLQAGRRAGDRRRRPAVLRRHRQGHRRRRRHGHARLAARRLRGEPRATRSSSTASSTSPTAAWARSARCPRAARSPTPRTATSRPRSPATTRSSPRASRDRSPTAARCPRSPTSWSAACTSRCSTSAPAPSPSCRRRAASCGSPRPGSRRATRTTSR